MFDYWKFKRAYNILELNYETLKTDDEYKDRVITRQKNEIKKLKEDLKRWQQPEQRKKKKR